MTARTDDEGVVLINVLVVLAIAGGLMLLLISTQEAALDRVTRARDASIVEQIALGAEATVVDALRRDLDEAPDSDHLNEPWAKSVIQSEVILPTGKFSVTVTDVQSKFDINQLAGITAASQDFMQRLLTALDKDPQIASQIAQILAVTGPLDDPGDLEAFGISPEALAALAPYITALLVAGTINLNSVDPFLLGLMLKNRSLAAQLVRLRDSRGALTLDDLNDVGALRPQNSGFTSNVYHVDILAQAGVAQVRIQTLLIRRNTLGVKAVEIRQRRLVFKTPEPASE